MAQVVRGRPQREDNARVALEVSRSPTDVQLLMFSADGGVELVDHPLEWSEVAAYYAGGRRMFSFDDQFKPLLKAGEPYPVHAAARLFLRGSFAAPTGFKGGALEALGDVLPTGAHHLFTEELGFLGRFESREDAFMLAAAVGVLHPAVFDSPEAFKALGVVEQGVVLRAVSPERRWPAKLSMKHCKEVYEMATKQAKKKATKVAKAEAKQRRADGPVAKCREIFERIGAGAENTAKILEACEKAGINKGTATTQLGRYRKTQGINVRRGGPRKNTEPSAKKSAKPEAKPAAKKKKAPAKKKAKPKPPQATASTGSDGESAALPGEAAATPSAAEEQQATAQG